MLPAIGPIQAMPGGEPEFGAALVAQRRALQQFIVQHLARRALSDLPCPQDFLAAAQMIEQFRGERALMAWQYGVALRIAGALCAPPRSGSPALSWLHCRLGWARQWHLRESRLQLADLPSELRGALFLAGVGQLSMDQAAVLLCLPLHEVRRRLGSGWRRWRAAQGGGAAPPAEHAAAQLYLLQSA